MQTFRIFNTVQEARDYRFRFGTGGWIFHADADCQQQDGTNVILFPVDMMPSHIFRHTLTKGRSGKLIGN